MAYLVGLMNQQQMTKAVLYIKIDAALVVTGSANLGHYTTARRLLTNAGFCLTALRCIAYGDLYGSTRVSLKTNDF